MAQPHRPSENQHSVRLALGNGLRPQIWKEFQTRFGIKQIGEFYGSTEGTASIINIDSTPGACGFMSEIIPKAYPVVIFKVDPETGELVRGPDGLAVKTKAGEVGQIVGKTIKGACNVLSTPSPGAAWLSNIKSGKHGARRLTHQSHSAKQTTHSQSHNANRTTLNHGATPGDKANLLSFCLFLHVYHYFFYLLTLLVRCTRGQIVTPTGIFV